MLKIHVYLLNGFLSTVVQVQISWQSINILQAKESIQSRSYTENYIARV